jgi:hypothetical protein
MLKRNLLRSASVLVALGALLAAAAAAADAAPSWHDGVAAQSYVFNPCLNITEFGALAQTGYSSDPAATHAGDVFYAHVLFGAATYVGGNCTNTDQAAELDVSPPPGVSLAVSAANPIYCFYTDSSNTGQPLSPCPTHGVNGTYGTMLPAGDGGGAWDMPPGRTIEVQFPLVSNRELRGPAGGHCPDTLDELNAGQPRDCLLAPVHVLDGSDDPWLLPNEDMVIAAAPATGTGHGTTPGGAGGSAPGSGSGAHHASLKAPGHVRMRALLSRGLRVALALPSAGASATLTLLQGHHTLGHVTKRHLKAGRVSVTLKLSKSGRRRLRHASHAKLMLVEKLSNPKVTLRRTVLAKR